MDRLRSIQTFTRLASTASFSKAAELLGISRAAVSRQVSELETHLGVSLLRRNTRHVSLTEVGQHYLQECSAILRRLDQADQDIAGMQHSLSGSLPLLEQFQVESRALYAIYPSRASMPRKVKTFVSFLQERYRDPPWDGH